MGRCSVWIPLPLCQTIEFPASLGRCVDDLLLSNYREKKGIVDQFVSLW